MLASFARQLQTILQSRGEKVNQTTPLIELGIYSLIAVEIRLWFVKELKVDLPVLKILGGASVASLSQHALEVPIDVLLAELNVPRSSQHSPLFQAFFDCRQSSQDSQPFDTCQLVMQGASFGRTAYDITLDINDSSQGTIVAIRTQSALYDCTAANLLLNSYVGLLKTPTDDVCAHWADVPLFRDESRLAAIDLGRGESISHLSNSETVD